MSKGFCEGCQSLQIITTTPTPVTVDKEGNQVGTSRYWRLDMHRDETPGTCSERVPHPIHHQEDEECGQQLPCKEHGWPLCSKSGDLI